MRVGVIQSSYAPWRGYFDFIVSVDLFIIYDNVRYSNRKGTWRNRNRVKTSRGLRWMTVPISASGQPVIDEVCIVPSPKPWRNTHQTLLTESLRAAPFFDDALAIWREGTQDSSGRLSPLNVQLIRTICRYLGIRTPIVDARHYASSGAKTERLIHLIKQAGATTYLSGPAARDYLDESLFRENKIRLEYKSYDYSPYPQLWGEFEGAVTVLDLIANVGPEAAKHLRSRTPDVVAVP
ncbi:MAG: WbqC family protein [Planctomycetaceae bacterium]|nr:WbqC family protein [Planctomycetaceae bacterium]